MARSNSPRFTEMTLPTPRGPGRRPQPTSGVFLRGLGWIGKGVLSFLQVFTIALTALGMSLFAVLILLLEPMPEQTQEVQPREPLQVPSPSSPASRRFEAWKSPSLEDRSPDQPPGPVSSHPFHPMDRFLPTLSQNASHEPGSMAAYFDQIQGKITDLWKPPPLSVPGQLSVVIAIGIGASGRLTLATVARPSGDRAFDESALQAIRQASPFPPLPVDSGDPFQVELRFHVSRKGRPLRVQALQERRVPKGEPTQGDGVETEHIEEQLKVTPEKPHPILR